MNAIWLLLGTLWSAEPFPPELVRFDPVGTVVFAAAPGQWDAKIRERGWILRDETGWRLFYTGYAGARTDRKRLGLATSPDGIRWTRSPMNPLLPGLWVEDMQVVRDGAALRMVAEGETDLAHGLVSADGLNWTPQGTLDIRLSDGKTAAPEPRGTPTLYLHGGRRWLFYERHDAANWLASSPDGKVWTNVSDEPVLKPGPDAYDRHAVAIDQVLKHGNFHYAFYHSADAKPWKDWHTCLARSADLKIWEKYPGNPVLRGVSSTQAVPTADGKFVLFSMHGAVRRHAPLP